MGAGWRYNNNHHHPQAAARVGGKHLSFPHWIERDRRSDTRKKRQNRRKNNFLAAASTAPCHRRSRFSSTHTAGQAIRRARCVLLAGLRIFPRAKSKESSRKARIRNSAVLVQSARDFSFQEVPLVTSKTAVEKH